MKIPALQMSRAPAPAESPSAWLVGAVLCAATLIAYWPALSAGYIWDDDSYLTANPLVQGGADGLARIWIEPKASPQYYPLVFTSFWIEHKLWGLQPRGYHAVNVLLHIANALLVWRIARRLRIPLPWLIGAIFALHPVHVESVAWVTERKNVLSGLFYLLALREFLIWSDGGPLAWGRYALGALFFVCALLSKSVTAMLAPSLPLILWYYHGRLALRHIIGVLPLLAIGAAKGLLTAKLEMEKVGAQGAEWSQTLAERALLIAPSAYVFYAQKILWPVGLTFMYPRWELSQADATWYVPLAIAIAGLVIALLGRRRWGFGPFVLLVFSAINLFPALGFLNVYPHRYSFVADHFQYLGSIGFIVVFVSIGVGLGRRLLAAAQRRQATFVVAVALLAMLAWRTNAQSGVYQNSQVLYEANLRDNPNSWHAMINLGSIYLNQARELPEGDDRRRKLLDAAVAWSDRATNYPTARYDAYTNLGSVAHERRDYSASVAALQEALQFAPPPEQDMSGYDKLAIALKDAGRFDEAVATLDEAIKIRPERAAAWYTLSIVQFAAGRGAPAAEAASRAVALAPERSELRLHQATILYKTDRFTEAATAFAEVLKRRPEWSDVTMQWVLALYESGQYADAIRVGEAALAKQPQDMRMRLQVIWMLATCPDDKLRNGRRAASLADPVARGGLEGAPWQVLNAVAAAKAENGDYPTAVMLARDARESAAKEGRTEELAALDARVETYRQNRPFRHTAR